MSYLGRFRDGEPLEIVLDDADIEVERLREDRDAWKATAEMLMRRVVDED